MNVKPGSCLQHVNTPGWQLFFRRSAGMFSAIHRVLSRQIALVGKKLLRLSILPFFRRDTEAVSKGSNAVRDFFTALPKKSP